MRMAIEKARQYGMGSVAVRDSTHFGIAGYYPLMAIKEGMIGFTVTNARPSTSPTFGVQPLLGTNPIAFGAPTDEDFPFLYDGATPITQRGKVEVYAREEKTVPEGWIIDQNNQNLTDSNEILEPSYKRAQHHFSPWVDQARLWVGTRVMVWQLWLKFSRHPCKNGAFLTALSGVDEDGNVRPFRGRSFLYGYQYRIFPFVGTIQKDHRRDLAHIAEFQESTRPKPYLYCW